MVTPEARRDVVKASPGAVAVFGAQGVSDSPDIAHGTVIRRESTIMGH